jgi:hypothetical protein
MWKPIVFGIPERFGYSNASGGSVLGQLLSSPEIDEINPDAEFETGAITSGGYAAFAVQHIKHLVVHPWQQGVGQGIGVYRYLSPRNAVNVAANKLDELADKGRPANTKNYDVVSLLLSASGYAAFANHLNQLLQLFSEPTVYMCARRSAQLATLEQTKIVLPDAAVNARWLDAAESGHATWCNYVGAVAHADSFSFADEYGQRSLEEAVMLVSHKRAALANAANLHAEEILQTISGAHSGKVSFIKDQPINVIKKLLLASDTGYEMPLSVCVLYVGEVDSLNSLREFFSV